jgi:hypothetical protein
MPFPEKPYVNAAVLEEWVRSHPLPNGEIVPILVWGRDLNAAPSYIVPSPTLP